MSVAVTEYFNSENFSDYRKPDDNVVSVSEKDISELVDKSDVHAYGPVLEYLNSQSTQYWDVNLSALKDGDAVNKDQLRRVAFGAHYNKKGLLDISDIDNLTEKIFRFRIAEEPEKITGDSFDDREVISGKEFSSKNFTQKYYEELIDEMVDGQPVGKSKFSEEIDDEFRKNMSDIFEQARQRLWEYQKEEYGQDYQEPEIGEIKNMLKEQKLFDTYSTQKGRMTKDGFKSLLFDFSHDINKLKDSNRRQKQERKVSNISFGVDKTISAFMALGDEDMRKEFSDFLRNTAQNYMSEIAVPKYFATRVRKNGANHNKHTDQLMYFISVDDKTRPVELTRKFFESNDLDESKLDNSLFRKETFVQDPQWHVDLDIPNFAFQEDENKFYALQKEKFIAHIQDGYRGYMISSIGKFFADRGVDIESTGRSIRLTGIEDIDQLAALYSKRSFQIKSKLEEKLKEKQEQGDISDLSTSEKANLGRETAEAKSRSNFTEEETYKNWQYQGKRVVPKAYDAIKKIHKNIKTNNFQKIQTSKDKVIEAVDKAIATMFDAIDTVRPDNLIGQAQIFAGNVKPQLIREEVEKRAVKGEIIMRETTEKVLITTKEILDIKAEIRDNAKLAVKNNVRPLLKEYKVPDTFVADDGEEHKLHQGQKECIKELVSSPKKIRSIQGVAGAGKSTVLMEVKKVYDSVNELNTINVNREYLIKNGILKSSLESYKKEMQTKIDEEVNGIVLKNLLQRKSKGEPVSEKEIKQREEWHNKNTFMAKKIMRDIGSINTENPNVPNLIELLDNYKKEIKQKQIVVTPLVGATEVLNEVYPDAITLQKLIAKSGKGVTKFKDEKFLKELRNSVVTVDEIDVASRDNIKALMELQQEYNFTLNIIGDKSQLKGVKRPMSLSKLLEEEVGVKTVIMSDIMRQKGDLKTAIEFMNKKEYSNSVDKLQEIGSIKNGKSEDLIEMAAEKYFHNYKNGKRPMLGVHTHREGEKGSHFIRAKLKELARNGDTSILRGLATFINKRNEVHIPEEMKKSSGAYEKGMMIKFNTNKKLNLEGNIIKTFKNGEKYEIIESKDGLVTVKNATDSKAKKIKLDMSKIEGSVPFSIYGREKKMELMEGDLIRITKGQAASGKKDRYNNNGELLRIVGFEGGDKPGRPPEYILTEPASPNKNGPTQIKRLAADHFAIQYGYYNTPFQSQGKTAKDMICCLTDEGMSAMNKRSFYVLASRAKGGSDALNIFTPDTEKLKYLLENDDSQISALDLQKEGIISDNIERVIQTRFKRHEKTIKKFYKDIKDAQSKVPETIERIEKISRAINKRIEEIKDTVKYISSPKKTKETDRNFSKLQDVVEKQIIKESPKNILKEDFDKANLNVQLEKSYMKGYEKFLNNFETLKVVIADVKEQGLSFDEKIRTIENEDLKNILGV